MTKAYLECENCGERKDIKITGVGLLDQLINAYESGWTCRRARLYCPKCSKAAENAEKYGHNSFPLYEKPETVNVMWNFVLNHIEAE